MSESLLEEVRRYLSNHAYWLFYASVLLIAAWAGSAASAGDNLPLLAVAGVVGALIFVHEPALALAAVFVAMTFGAYWTLRLPGFKITAAKLLVGAAIGAWAGRSILDKSTFLKIMPVTPAYLVVAFGLVVTSQASMGPGMASVQLSTLFLLLLMNHVLFTAVTPRRFVLLMNVVAASGVTALLLGAIAGFGEHTRSSGLVRNSNEWAWISILLGYVSVGWLLAWRHPLRGFVLAATMVLVPVNLIQAASRGGILSFLVTLPLALILLRKERGLVGWLIPLGTAGIIVFATQALLVEERFDTLIRGDRSDGSLSVRTDLIQHGLELFRQHPILGVGPGMVPYYNAVQFPLDDVHPFHNSYLTILVEQGLFGLVCHAVLLTVLAAALVRGVRQARSVRLAQTGMGAGIGVLGFSVMMLTGDDLMAYPMAHFILGLGLIVERMSRETGPLPPALADPQDPPSCISPS